MTRKHIYYPIHCSCTICKKELTTATIDRHFGSAACLRATKDRFCKVCGVQHYKKGPFCSIQCSSSSNHKHVRGFNISQPVSIMCSCVWCHKELRLQNFPRHIKYCNIPKQPRDISKSSYRTACKFRFGIKTFPDWFSAEIPLLDQHGWYSPSNKLNNLNGCSRDHMFSVSDGYKHNIPASIVSHPANCSIMPHPQNQQKHTSSSITLDELYSRILDFEKLYGRAIPESNRS